MRENSVKIVNNSMMLSTAAVCELFDIDRKTLTNWRRNGLPKDERGWWALSALLTFRGLRGESSGREKSLAEQKLLAEIALKESQGELSRLKNEILAGKYLEAYYVESELKRFFTIIKRSCLNLARKVSGQAAAYVEPDVARRLEHEIHKTITDALHQLSIGGIINAKR